MVEENFENWHSKRVQIDSILLSVPKILKLFPKERPDNYLRLSQIAKLQHRHFEGPDFITFITHSPCLKKILKLNNLKSCRLVQFYYFLSVIPSPWFDKISRFDLLKNSRMAQFYYFLSIIPSPWSKKILRLDL